MHNIVIITSNNKVIQKRHRFTRKEVIAAAKKNLQRYIDGDRTVKVYL